MIEKQVAYGGHYKPSVLHTQGMELLKPFGWLIVENPEGPGVIAVVGTP